ncbi:putative 8-amino-7-oxononanoate synthase [Holospora elegans E1]|uniref:8-amino-7-oxononanoate synthase n=1 Tax=Holospora elegans E1 TaxID=1427503 RepID=A0A023DZ80_9PROT|nr:8-amino-7-oxononanoate synthase [Holospora elegans]GAJ46635.1 putative 8-amino-7-oxononanoate synthase [Holospora elegans E1]GAJ46851.1 putative 8-amino-7-oxononanoate synthase [Holospora elegans E1]
MYTPYQDYIHTLNNTLKYRKLPIFRQEKFSSVLDFSNNDYLGLSQHPKILKEAINAIQIYGMGAKSSRISSIYHPFCDQLETQIALDKKTEAALFFSSGFQANFSVLSAILDRGILGGCPVVFSDRLNHASIYQALLFSQCEWVRYRHLDTKHLQCLLEKYAKDSRPKFIVTETVFGMDGDTAPLKDIHALALKYKTFVYLDEAHATGLFGINGYGCSTLQDWSQVPHIIMGTFSKALGGSGAYIACSKILKEYLINKAQGFIYSTAPSPCVVAAALRAWNLIKTMNKERLHLKSLGESFRKMLTEQGEDIGSSTTHIIPIILKNEESVMEIQHYLGFKHIYVSGIRPPTVPPNQARLRIGLKALHTQEDLLRFMQEWKKLRENRIY